MPNNFLIDGKTPEMVYTEIIKTGVSAHEASLLVGEWIVDWYGRSRRVFNYTETFAAANPGCEIPAFVRQLQHRPWRDGEDVVQAEPSADDEGFNARFEKIQDDLDELAERIGQLSNCMKEMRASLSKALAEIRVELNKINSDLYEMDSGPSFQTAQPPAWSGVESGKYLGIVDYLDKKMQLWQTSKGMFALPLINLPKDPRVTNPVANITGMMNKFFVENDLFNQFDNGFSTQEFIRQFGNESLGNGMLVSDAMSLVRDREGFESPQHLISSLAGNEALIVRTTTGVQSYVGTKLGFDVSAEDAGSAPIESFSGVSNTTKQVLGAMGVNTVNDLAQANMPELSNKLQEAGMGQLAPEVADMQGAAMAMLNMQMRVGMPR
jgi:hypothetical protein